MVDNNFDFNSEIVTIPEGVELIDYDFIKQFKNIKKIILPSTLKYIDNETFKNCTTLEEIDIPDAIEQIGYEAFSGCTSLKRVNLPNKYFYIQPYAFSKCISLTQFTLPDDIKYFSEGLLFGCINLEKINCSDKLTYIDDYALYNCHKLNDFKISSTTTHIGEFAMFGCDSITKISIPRCTERIGFAAFGMMKSLRRIMVDSGNERYKNAHNMLIDRESQSILQYAIADSEENVSISMFYNDPIHDANNDEELDMMSRAESIADYAFAGAKNIKTIDAFSSLESIGMHTFLGCDNLERFNFVFYNFGKDISIPIATFGHDKSEVAIPFKNIFIPNGVTVIGGCNATFFQNTEYIFLPVTVEEIHYKAFSLSKNLKEIKIPNCIRIICPNSFNENTKVSLPFLKDKIDSKDLFFMTTIRCGDYKDYIDINFCVMKDGTYYVIAKDEMYFKIKTNKNYYDVDLNDSLHLSEEFYSPYSVSYDLEKMIDINIDDIYNLCKKCLKEDITNDDLYAILPNSPCIERIEAKSYTVLAKDIVEEYGIFDEDFLNVFLDFNFSLRDIHEYCKNYSKTMSMMFKHGELLKFFQRFYFGPEYIINYCKLLDKYGIKDRLLYNPAFFIHLDEEECELFLSRYNKNIRHILINSNAFDGIGNNLGYIFNILRCCGTFDDDEILSQRVQTFFNEKVFGKDSKCRIIDDDIESSFNGIKMREETDYEFSEFFIKNYEDLFKLNLEYPGIISTIYNVFSKLIERSTSNKGCQRQLKVTLKDCVSYLMLNNLNESKSEKDNLTKFLNDYFPDQEVVDEAYRLVNESKNAPRNIFIKVLYDESNNPIYSYDVEEDLCEDIGSCDFTYDWLPKQSWDNLILGKRCSCCAHVIGAGAGITRASMIRDDCQNLVIRNKKGKIVAKMTFYVNKDEGYGVFNTAEVNLSYRDDETIRKIYEAFIRGCNAFISEYNKNNFPSLELITIGEYRNVIKYELGNIEVDSLDTPNYSDYAHYRNFVGDDGEHHRVVGQYDGDSKDGQILVYSKKGSINNGN